MPAISPTGTKVPTTSPHPVPVPPRWHLRTQVSRKTLFDLIQGTLPPTGRQVTSVDGKAITPDSIATESAAAGPAAPGPGFTGSSFAGQGCAGPGVLPQSYLDTLAATAPMSLNPASLWTDGDTTPDIPEHWRPITISLASTPPFQSAALPPPPPPPRHPLYGVARTGGWMLAGAALTFLVSAASFGGKPMLRAIRAVMVPQALVGPGSAQPAPAPIPARAPAFQPAHDAPAGGAVVALAERSDRPATVPPSPAADRTNPNGDAALDNARGGAGDRKIGAASAHAAHRARPERRLTKTPLLAQADRADSTLPSGDDAVMPLELAAPEHHAEPLVPRASARSSAANPAMIVAKPAIIAAKAPTVIAKAPPAIAKTSASPPFRAIDIQDPFAGQ